MKFVHFSKTLPSSGPQGIKDDYIAHMLCLWHNNVVHPFNKCGLHCNNSKSSITMSNVLSDFFHLHNHFKVWGTIFEWF